ncbi:MAG: LysM domain-containing protein [Phycisphaerales bacterium]
MTRSPSKLVFGMALLLAVWITVFWMWKPRPNGASGAEGGITFENPQDMARALAATDPVLTRRGPEAPAVKPLPVAPLPNQQPGHISPAPAPLDPSVQPVGKRLVAPEFTDYTVQKGDGSFAAISKRLYGTTKHADAISRANPFVTPDRLVAGKTKLRIPKDPTNIQGKVEDGAGGEPDRAASTPPAGGAGGSNAGEQTHTVQAGETLGAISKRYYGTTTRWKAILDANTDVLDKPERLKAGMTLKIPAKD